MSRKSAKPKVSKRAQENIKEAKRLLAEERGRGAAADRIKKTPAAHSNGGSHKNKGGNPNKKTQRKALDMSKSNTGDKKPKAPTIKSQQALASEAYHTRVKANATVRQAKKHRANLQREYTKLTKQARRLENKFNAATLRGDAKKATKLANELEKTNRQRVSNSNKRRGLSNRLNANQQTAIAAEQVRQQAHTDIATLKKQRATKKSSPKKQTTNTQSTNNQRNQTDDTQTKLPYDIADPDPITSGSWTHKGGGESDFAATIAIHKAAGSRWNENSGGRQDIMTRNTARMLSSLDDAGYKINGQSPTDYLTSGGDPNNPELVNAINDYYNWANPVSSFIYNLSE